MSAWSSIFANGQRVRLALIILIPVVSALNDLYAATQITYHEAEILMYLLPDSHRMREQGMDVTWSFNSLTSQGEFFSFTLVGDVKESGGSRTLGHYAVNKQTAEVMDVETQTVIHSKELDGIAKILRRAHEMGVKR